jgi:hypothetical protein
LSFSISQAVGDQVVSATPYNDGTPHAFAMTSATPARRSRSEASPPERGSGSTETWRSSSRSPGRSPRPTGRVSRAT